MSIHVGIVADDLTGAADTAAGFHRAGFSSAVVWGAGAVGPADIGPLDVLAVNTGSRAATEANARQLVADSLEAFGALGVNHLYQKIDSTLRGHVASDVAAGVARSRSDVVVVAPAFPETGRTTRAGRQYVGSDPLAGPSLVDLLASAGVQIDRCNLATVRDQTMAQQVGGARARGVHALVCDAETPADLAAIAVAGLEAGVVHWVGSGGLARELATALRLPRRRAVVTPAAPALPVLIAIGTAHPMSHAQVPGLVRDGVEHVRVPSEHLASAARGPRESWARIIARALEGGRDVVVTIDAEAVCAEDEHYVAGLAAILADSRHWARSLVVTGGTTASHLFDAWGITGLDLCDEVQPGVPVAWSRGSRRVHVITKAGGFGDAETLARARAWLRSMVASDSQAVEQFVR